MKYICSICGYVYEEEGNTPWSELPEGWKCPLCGAAKTYFSAAGGAQPSEEAEITAQKEVELRQLTALEISALCTNLAKGCEKQYQQEQAEAFRKLADWFGAQDSGAANPSFQKLLDLVNADLGGNYPAAGAAARKDGDRGALRSLTWGEKVTMILKSLLLRYAQGGGNLLRGTGVYVCTICGFVFVGDELPEVCPVCKVPNHKFERIGG